MASMKERNFYASVIRSQIVKSIDEHCMVNVKRPRTKGVNSDCNDRLVGTSDP